MKHKKPEKSEEQKPSERRGDGAEELRQQIESLQKEKDELFAKLQRVGADYENFQKRVPKQIADTVTYEKEKIIKTLLPALDNFEHTLQNAQSAESVDVLFKGVKIIYDQMLDILKLHGVEQIRALGEKFDPALHQAMLQKAEPEQEDGIVLEEFQAGYKLNGRVVRPSRVVVNKLSGHDQREEDVDEEPAQDVEELESDSQ